MTDAAGLPADTTTAALVETFTTALAKASSVPGATAGDAYRAGLLAVQPVIAAQAARDVLSDPHLHEACEAQLIQAEDYAREAANIAAEAARQERQRILAAIDAEAERRGYDVTEVFDVAWPHLAHFVADLLEDAP